MVFNYRVCRVQREANVLCRFEHPNIVKIFGVTDWYDDSDIGIVLEYIDGGNLHDFLESTKSVGISWETRLRLASEIASALSHIHSYKKKKTLCHGDLKPGNILLTKQLQAKLADFGSAFLIIAPGASETTLEIKPNDQHTPVYLAPEYWNTPRPEKKPAMDVYGLSA